MSSAQWADSERDRELVVKFKRFIVGSLIAHVIAITVALLVGYINFRPDYSDSAMIVNFRGRPGPRAKGEAGARPPAPEPKAAAAPAPAPKPEPKPEPKAEPKPLPKPAVKPEPKPEPKTSTHEVSPDKSKVNPKKPDPKKPDPKAEPKTEPKTATTPPKPDPKKPAPDLDAAPAVAPGNADIAMARELMTGRGKGGIGDGPGGGGDWDGVEGYEGDGALGNYHAEEFWLAIEDIMSIPPDPTFSLDDAVQIVIQIDNKGKILDAVIFKASNNPNFNRYIEKGLEGVKSKKDLPPPPKPSKEGFYFMKYTITPSQGA